MSHQDLLIQDLSEENIVMVDNILTLDKTSEIYLTQEVQDEKYEILFGDGFFGKKLENNQI